ncbi:reverse transcriptase domain-containing protein [Citrus sinensis]|nr:reverse transcriptase domain-containing protein [Citrus sinensis]
MMPEMTAAYDSLSIGEDEEDGLVFQSNDMATGQEGLNDVRFCLVGRFLTDKVLTNIGNYIGEFQSSDPNNLMGVWRNFMLIRVSIDVRKPLKKRLRLKNEGGEWFWVDFKYERLYGPEMKALTRRNAMTSGERRLRSVPPNKGGFTFGMPTEFVSGAEINDTNATKSGVTTNRKMPNNFGRDGHEHMENMEISKALAVVKIRENQRNDKGKWVDWFTNELDIVHMADNCREKSIVLKETKRRRAEMVVDGHGQSEGDVQSMVVDPKNGLVVGPETLYSKSKLESIKRQLGYDGLFVVERVGRSEGLALLWQATSSVRLLKYATNFIDAEIEVQEIGKWRLTGFYGYPESSKRRESWDLLRLLSSSSSLPCLCIGDFNDLLAANEKRGKIVHPNWKFVGFQRAIEDCNLIDLGVEGYQYTWERARGTDRWVEERLDRAFTSEAWLQRFTKAKVYTLESSCSDHLPIFLDPSPGQYITRNRRFRFENVWLREVDCSEVIRESWHSNPGHSIQNKILACGSALTEWGSHLGRNFRKRIMDCKNRMASLRGRRDRNGVAEFTEARNRYNKLLHSHEVFWKQRAKSLWLREGDQNTRYFHASASARKRQNSLGNLRNDQGEWCANSDEVDALIVDYFKGLFTVGEVQTAEVLQCVATKVTSEHNSMLLAPFSAIEVKDAVFGMHPDKSPGPDGMNPTFYQKFWHIVGEDVVLACLKFLQDASFPVGLNDTSIVLIPKKQRPEFLSNMRPIALCNVLYKIISKMLANRMKLVLDLVISDSQSAFVPGQAITDNIIISAEIMHFLKRKRQGKNGVAALKIDMSKAYDRIEWKFLQDMMPKMGFDAKWVALMMLCVSTVRYRVLHEGKELGPIVPCRGLRQGDPLSPYLFILCVDGLSSLIRRQERNGLIHGVRIARGAPSVSHLFFSDDSFLFFWANDNEANLIKHLLAVYGRASGQVVNFSKSSISFSANVVESVSREICAILESTRMLSWAGKEILLKTVALALPNYAMSIYLLPKELCRELEGLMNSFWWRNNHSSGKGINWVKWEYLCNPKGCGGLGFKQLHLFNIAMLGRQMWKLLTCPESLMARILKARYYPRTSVVRASLGHNPSYVWRSILAAKEVVVQGSRVQVGSGHSISIGKDPWLPDLQDGCVSTNLNEELAAAPVSSLMMPHQRVWDYDVVSDIFNLRDKELILKIPLSSRREEDMWYWMADPLGCYSVRSCYKVLNPITPDSGANVWRKLWNLQVPNKVKNFIWRAAHNVLPTATNLISKRVDVPSTCSVCNAYEKTVLHSLVACSFAQSCWNSSSVGFVGYCSTFLDWLAQVFIRCRGFLAARCVEVAGNFGAREAEALGIREALSWMKELQFPCVIIEMDCLQVFRALVEEFSSPNGFGLIIEDCRALVKFIGEVQFSFVRRSANCAAHSVARASGSLSGLQEWNIVPPLWLLNSFQYSTAAVTMATTMGFLLRPLCISTTSTILSKYQLRKPHLTSIPTRRLFFSHNFSSLALTPTTVTTKAFAPTLCSPQPLDQQEEQEQ